MKYYLTFIKISDIYFFMYIVRTKTNTSKNGVSYYAYRLVTSERVNGKVKRRTLLNLGKNFSLERDKWPILCKRIEEILSGKSGLFKLEVPADIEELAQEYANRLIILQKELRKDNKEIKEKTEEGERDFREVDINSLEMMNPRSIGIEHVGLEMMKELGLPEILSTVGMNGVQIKAIIGSIIGRLSEPGSELSTWKWLRERSGLGELLGYDYKSMSLMQLYRASDKLISRHKEIEDLLFKRIRSIFSLTNTITLYDLTNTYFEGDLRNNKKAKRGRSKEKRNDRPLLTLGLVLDSSGFIIRSKIFEGNVSEGETLSKILEELEAAKGSLIIMDRGISKSSNIKWLKENGYRYLVVSKEAKKILEGEETEIESKGGSKIKLYRQEEEGEVRLYCYSELKEKKEREISEYLCKKYEEELTKIASGLSKRGGLKRRDKVLERIGRAKMKSQGIWRHYEIKLRYDDKREKVIELSWTKKIRENSKLSHPGVYCLRTNQKEWSSAQLWQTYTMLTDLEGVFKSLKSELGLRPNYHRKEVRSDGHIFITILAYQVVQSIRRKLREHGITESWSSLRKIMKSQYRVTASFQQKDKKVMHVRKSTVLCPKLLRIYEVLNIEKNPGGTKKVTV